MSNKIIKFDKLDIEKINIFLLPGLSKKIDECFENMTEISEHPEHIHIIEEFCDFSENLEYTAGVYCFSELQKIGELLNKIFINIAEKKVNINTELQKIIKDLLDEIRKWIVSKGESTQQLKKYISEITVKTEDSLKFAALSKKKKEEDKDTEKVVAVTSAELRQLKECIYDLYTNFSYLAKTIDENLPNRYIKKKWFQDYKNIERAFTANLTGLQKEYFSFRRMEIKSMLQDIEYEIRNFAMLQNKTVKIKFDGADIKMDVYCIEKVYQILLELLKNSVQHSFNCDDKVSAVNEIVIRFTDEKNCIFIEIKDNGCGFDYEDIIKKARARGIINEAEIENINEIFFNVLLCISPTQSKNKKAGLKNVKSNIEKLNGSIKIKVGEVKGANISIELPLFKKIV